MEKRCVKCGLSKSIEEFWPAPSSKDGRHSYCRACANAHRNAWYRTSAGRAHQHRQHKLPAKRLGAARFAAKKRKLSFELTKEEFIKLLTSPCTYCGSATGTTGSSLDRKDSSKGYTAENVVPCCRVCNVAKSDFFTYVEMIELGKAIQKILRQRPSYRQG